MESILDFKEEIMNVDDDNKEILSSTSSSLNGYKLVPWLSWGEWDFVRESLFSSSSNKVASALKRISTWRSRGCLPVVIDVTASIIEIQQKDPYYSYRDEEDQPADVLDSEQLLAMLYCMAILRLVNCVVEKKRRKTKVSIAEAAKAIGIPRKLIDVRHEGSHRDLPALQVVRDCSDKALDWLRAYYWEPQKKQIPFQGVGTADMQRDIRSTLSELAACLNVKQNPQHGSSLVKGKRGKYFEGLCGRNKFIPIIAGKLHSSKSGGSKNKITQCLKVLVKLYSSFSSEIVSEFLEFLLNSFDYSNLEFPTNLHIVKNVQASLDDWKPVITRFSNKEPDLLLSLLKAVLDIIEHEEAKKYGTGKHQLSLFERESAKKYGTGEQNLTSSECKMGAHQIEHLSCLFAWLVGVFGSLKPLGGMGTAAKLEASSADKNICNAVQVELLRRCLLLSATGNKLLMDSSLHLSQLFGYTSIVDKLKKLSSICLSHLDVSEESSSLASSKSLLIQQEESISQAAKKLELLKSHKTKSKFVKTVGDEGNFNRWVVAKSWNSCPIGMLPRDLVSSGLLPLLDRDADKHSDPELLEKKETWELNRCSGKREASCDIQLLDNPSVKKMKETLDVCQSDHKDVSLFEGSQGHLMVGGVWKKVGEEEVESIKSGVRILV